MIGLIAEPAGELVFTLFGYDAGLKLMLLNVFDGSRPSASQIGERTIDTIAGTRLSFANNGGRRSSGPSANMRC